MVPLVTVTVSSAWMPSPPAERVKLPPEMYTFPLEWMASSQQSKSKVPPEMVTCVPAFKPLALVSSSMVPSLPPAVMMVKLPPSMVRTVSA